MMKVSSCAGITGPLTPIKSKSSLAHLLPHLKLNSADTNLADVLARLLLIRGIDDPEKAQRYLFPSIDHLALALPHAWNEGRS